jgi:hypothetical protein
MYDEISDSLYDIEAGDQDEYHYEPEEPSEPIVTYLPGTTFINVYEIFQSYGGPEEGGWWYNVGTLVRSVQVPTALADGYVAMLEKEYPHTGEYYKVNYSGGDFRTYYDDAPGADFPSEVPHYE